MKIAVLGTRGIPASYGGFETCAEQLARRWTAAGHEVLLYARRRHYERRPALVDGVEVHYTGSIDRFGLGTPSAGLLSVIHLLFCRRAFRHVHLYNTGNGLLVPLLRLFGFRVVISVDGIEWRRDKWGLLQKLAHRLGASLAVRFAHRVVTDNRAVTEFYRQRFGCSTATIAYGAQTIRRTRAAEAIMAQFGLDPGGYCIFIGRLVPEKGVRQLIEAFRRLRTPLKLVIVGDDAPTPYRNDIWSQQDERVRLLGFQYGEVCEQLLVNARMYVSASMLEGTSPALLSAMSAGVCCLVNGIPENRNTAENSVAMFRENDFADLAATWQVLLDTPDCLERIAASGQEYQRQHYDWDLIAKQYIDLFQEVDDPQATLAGGAPAGVTGEAK